MTNQSKYPFLRLLIPFLVGTYIGFHPIIEYDNRLNIILIILFFFVCLVSFYLLKSYGYRWIFGAAMSLFLVFFGIERTYIATKKPIDLQKIEDSTFNGYLEVRILEPPVVKELTTRLLIEVTGLQGVSTLNSNKVKLLIYLQNSTEMSKPDYGSFITFNKKPERITSPINPNQFNYRQYLALQGIYHQVYLKNGDWELLPKKKINKIFEIANWCRNYLLNVLKNNGLKGDEYAVASAILLGNDDELPQYLRKGYVASGTMHALCVSGLHVGIIYLIFNVLFGLILVKKSTENYKYLLLLLVIWFYAMITGLTPSVLRSTIMLSFVLFGSLINRKGNIINSLAASAFLLVLFDPATLLNIGFQLSYSAVLGIALFQKPIYNMLYVSNKALNWIWEAVSVTVSAQLLTAPVILYYFHQFPVYFIFSNLIVIPLSFVIIVLGMAVLILSFLPLIPYWLGYATSAFIYLMNYLVTGIERMPFSTLNGIYITQYEVVILFFILGLLWIFAEYRNYRTVLPMIAATVLVSISISWRNLENIRSNQIVVYGINKHTAIELIRRNEHLIISDSTLRKDEFAIDFNMKGFWAKRGLSSDPQIVSMQDSVPENDFFRKKEDLISFGGKIFSIWTGDIKRLNSSEMVQKVDFVVVTNSKENLDVMLSYYNPTKLVLDMSVPYWQVEKWRKAAQKAKITLVNIKEVGAYIVDI